jgi:2-methylcitrate dehydratase PrpD
MNTIIERFGRFCADLRYEEIPKTVVTKAKVSLLNGIGIGLSCYGLESARAARRIVKEFEPAEAKGATLIADGALVSPLGAAFANGVLFHSRGQEDTYGTTHIGTMVIPASLAMTQWIGASGQELLTAVVAGYEITAALAKELTPLTTPRGFRASSIYGIFGSAAASAKLLRLDAAQTGNALALAAAFASGTTEAFLTGTMEIFFENGLASRNGLLATLAARSGMVGATTAIEGPFGFAKAFADTNKNMERIGDTLGSQWEILKVTFKPYPTCAFNQSPTVAMMNLIKAHDLKPYQVDQIKIRMNPYEANYPGINYSGPFTTHLQTLMSTGFALGLALKERKLYLSDMWRFDDKSLNELARLTKVEADERLSMSNCILSVRKKNGEELVEEFYPPPEYYFYDFEQDVDLIRRIHQETRVPYPVTDNLIRYMQEIEEWNNPEMFVRSLTFNMEVE